MELVVYLALVVPVAALACGHQAGHWPLHAAWRAAVRVIAPRKPLTASLAAEQPASDSSPATPAERRSQPRPRTAPSWAHTDKDAA